MAYVRGHQLVLRRVGRRRRARLELPRAAAALPAARGQLARRVGLSRQRRAAGGLRHDRSARRPSRVSRSGARARLRGAARLGFQRRRARSRAPASIRRTSATAAGIRRPPRFSCPRSRAPTSTVWPQTQALRLHRRRPPRDGRRGAARWRARARARDARGHSVRRRHRIAEAADAVRHRPGRRRSGGTALPVVADLPGVGANLQDHPRVGVRWARATAARAVDGVGRPVHVVEPRARRAAAAGPAVLCRPRARRRRIRSSRSPSRCRQPASRGAVTLRSADPLRSAGHPGQLLRRAGRPRGDGRGRAAGAGARRRRSAYDALRGAAVDPPEATRTRRRHPRHSSGARPTRSFTPPAPAAWAPVADAVVDAAAPRPRPRRPPRRRRARSCPTILNSQIHAACVVIGDMAADLIT